MFSDKMNVAITYYGVKFLIVLCQLNIIYASLRLLVFTHRFSARIKNTIESISKHWLQMSYYFEYFMANFSNFRYLL